MSVIDCGVGPADHEVVEELVELRIAQAGQQHSPHRRPRRRQPRADRQRDAHDPLRVDTRHVDDLGAVEHRCRHALVHAIRQCLHERLGDVGQLQRRDVGEAEVEHRGVSSNVRPSVHT